MSRRAGAIASVMLVVVTACTSSVGRFVSVNAPTVALSHVRVIDGSGGPGKDDQTLIIHGGRIQAVGDAARVTVPPSTRVFDLRGRTVFPGLIGMHEHLFYEYQPPGSAQRAAQAQDAFAKLYLACGVTTIRTGGTLDLGADARLKRAIDDGRVPGPKIHLTGRYLGGSTEKLDAEGIAQEVAAQADEGATSFKAYVTLRGAELRAAVKASHARGFRITGHLCAVGFREAASAGIDNVEHGLPFDTEFYSGKQPDVCPNQYDVFEELAGMEISDAQIHETIGALVSHGVAVTSTLAAIEMFIGREFPLDSRTLGVLAPGLQDQVRLAYEERRSANSRQSRLWASMLGKEMAFERAFVNAGGRLLAGVDPTGWGGIVAGFGDQRELELLVEAGFTPEQAIEIATANAAAYLFEAKDIGTVEAGKRADLVVVRGNPSTHIADVRNVEFVFKDGVGYDPAALIAAAQGEVQPYDLWHLLFSPLGLNLVTLVRVLLVAVIGRRVQQQLRRTRQPSDVAAIARSES